MASWTCDGEPKNGKQYPNLGGAHAPHENSGPDCVVCALPKEAMNPIAKIPPTTKMSGPSGPVAKRWLLPVILVAIFSAIAGASFVAWQTLRQPSISSNESIDSGDRNASQVPIAAGALVTADDLNYPQLMSQGEKLLLAEAIHHYQTSSAKRGAAAFAAGDWEEAAREYETAVLENRNNPEAQIYWENAKARQAGNPLTIAIIVSMNRDADTAAEVLRGVAQKQKEFNQAASGRLLEVILVNEGGALAVDFAEDLTQFPDLMGVMLYGSTPDLELALKIYQNGNLAVLSPVNIDISTEDSKLRLVPPQQKSQQLLRTYLNSVSQSVIDYARTQHVTPATAIFYNSRQSYSNNQRKILARKLSVEDVLIEEIDISSPDFDAPEAVSNLIDARANTLFLALNKEDVPKAIAILAANRDAGDTLTAI